MILNFTDMLYALSYALDAVESEFNGIMEGHGKRVAWISACMGRTAGMSRRELIDLTGLWWNSLITTRRKALRTERSTSCSKTGIPSGATVSGAKNGFG